MVRLQMHLEGKCKITDSSIYTIADKTWLTAYRVLYTLKFSLPLNLEQLDFEDQRGISWNLGRRATGAISQVRWDDKLPLLSDTHPQ